LGLGSVISGVGLLLKGSQLEGLQAIAARVGLIFAKDHSQQ
jgi:hypothetical protein